MWTILLSPKIKKQSKLLPKKIKNSFLYLLNELSICGYYRNNWPHFGKLINKNNCYHCHLKGIKKPTFVVCWCIIDKNKKIMEIYYVGTHENAPY